MLHELPPFVRCQSCANCYWFREVINDEDAPDAGADVAGDYIVEADEADMYAALRRIVFSNALFPSRWHPERGARRA